MVLKDKKEYLREVGQRIFPSGSYCGWGAQIGIICSGSFTGLEGSSRYCRILTTLHYYTVNHNFVESPVKSLIPSMPFWSVPHDLEWLWQTLFVSASVFLFAPMGVVVAGWEWRHEECIDVSCSETPSFLGCSSLGYVATPQLCQFWQSRSQWKVAKLTSSTSCPCVFIPWVSFAFCHSDLA